MIRGPTQEEYEKLTLKQKIFYWACVAIISAIIGGLLIKNPSSIEMKNPILPGFYNCGVFQSGLMKSQRRDIVEMSISML